MKALQEVDYRIPEDISIIGLDGIPICEITIPPLTTMHVPKQLGMLAVTSLITKIGNDNKETVKIELSVELIERRSGQSD